MGLKALVKQNARLAFRLIGDLKTPITFEKSINEGFDLAAGVPILSTVETYDTFCVELNATKRASLHGAFAKADRVVVLLSDDSQKFEAYNRVSLAGTPCEVIMPISNDGYLTTIGLKEL